MHVIGYLVGVRVFNVLCGRFYKNDVIERSWKLWNELSAYILPVNISLSLSFHDVNVKKKKKVVVTYVRNKSTVGTQMNNILQGF